MTVVACVTITHERKGGCPAGRRLSGPARSSRATGASGKTVTGRSGLKCGSIRRADERVNSRVLWLAAGESGCRGPASANAEDQPVCLTEVCSRSTTHTEAHREVKAHRVRISSDLHAVRTP
jgi:hypothetical protein